MSDAAGNPVCDTCHAFFDVGPRLTDVPDLTQRSHLRREQSDHLERKGEVLGVLADSNSRYGSGAMLRRF